MRKAINFDIDTKRYKRCTNKSAPSAYIEIKKFLEKHEFEHRQGSGYISKGNVNNSDIVTLITNMVLNLNWGQYCFRKIDVTNIVKQHSVLDIIHKAAIIQVISNNNNIEI